MRPKKMVAKTRRSRYRFSEIPNLSRVTTSRLESTECSLQPSSREIDFSGVHSPRRDDSVPSVAPLDTADNAVILTFAEGNQSFSPDSTDDDADPMPVSIAASAHLHHLLHHW